MPKHIPSYPKVYAIGHAAIQEIFADPVIVQEKIDGSQFSFGKLDGELVCRSRGQAIVVDAPDKMFTIAVESAKSRFNLLREGEIVRCEYLSKPKHNTLSYRRVPKDNLIVFDIEYYETFSSGYLSPAGLSLRAADLGLETVPVFYAGEVGDIEKLLGFLDTESILGGEKIEGIVVKSPTRFTKDAKCMMGKYVREDFKEKHAGEWKAANPATKDKIQNLILQLRTPARWEKAVQHLRESGKLLGEPKDIGGLILELREDLKTEERDFIAEQLFNAFYPQIERGVVAGIAEWYKKKLLEGAFEVREV